MVRRSHNIMDALRECPPVPPEEPKLETLESVMPPKLRSGRFKATDTLIALLGRIS